MLSANVGSPFRRDIGCCEQREREDYAQLEDIRKVQGNAA